MSLSQDLDEPGKKSLDNMPSEIDIGDKTRSIKKHLKYMNI
jgi:hypothetical protein